MKDRRITNLLLVVMGNILSAAAVKLFLMPTELVTAGVTGIALLINRLGFLSVPSAVFLLNLCFLVIGWIVLGTEFALTTVISTFVYPIALGLMNMLMGNVCLSEDLMLNAIMFGLLQGAAIGLVVRAGSSTGGMDIPPLIMQKYLNVPLGAAFFGCDLCILLLQFFVSPAECVLYGVVLLLITTLVLDKVSLAGSSKTEVKIISRQYDQIKKRIFAEMDRGVTLVHAQGGFLGRETELILTVISNRELPKLNQIVKQIDPEALIIIGYVNEVHGRGFSLKKQDGKMIGETTGK